MRYRIENKAYPYQVTLYERGLTRTPHIHTHVELILLLKGSAVAFADGKSYEMDAGDLFLAAPSQIHYYQNQCEDMVYCLVLFSPHMDSTLEALLAGCVPDCPVVKSQFLPISLKRQLASIARTQALPGETGSLAAKGNLLTLLGNVLPLFRLRQAGADEDRDSVKAVLSYCMEHYAQPITLNSVADALHLSKFYISHMFRERMNYSFTRFLHDLRVEHACDVLKQKNVDITDAAFRSGFSSIRSFNRIFLENTGMSPRQYRKLYRQGTDY